MLGTVVASGPAEEARIPSSRGEALAFLNGERLRRAAPPLSPTDSLDRVAQARANEVLAIPSLPDAETPAERAPERARQAGYDPSLVAEIVLAGKGTLRHRLEGWRTSGNETFQDAVRPQYRDLGVGIARSGKRLIVVLVLGLSAEAAFTAATGALSDLVAAREQLLARVNEERQNQSLPPLRENALLDQAAQAHAEDMLRRAYYGHESPEGARVRDRARQASYAAQEIAENVAEGQPSVEQVMAGWMASPGHRDNILGPAFTEIGLGLAFGRNRRGYQVFWVQVFGSPQASKTPIPGGRPGPTPHLYHN